MNFLHIFYAQYPALFLLALLFLISYLRVRKASAVKSVAWVILFGIALAASVVCCFLGMQEKLWTLTTLFPLRAWSWVGIIIVLLVLALSIAHSIEKKMNRRKLEKAMKQAEREKNAEVSRAREEGAAAERERAAAATAPVIDVPFEDVAADAAAPEADKPAAEQQ